MSPQKVVDLSVLCANAAAVKAQCAELYAVVKADGYGHGVEGVVRAIDADGYCVARAKEGLDVRKLTNRPVVVMGYVTKEEAEHLINASVTLAITDSAQVSDFIRAARAVGRPALVWVKVDTGMHRFGLSVEEAEQLQLPSELVETGRFTHLADDDPLRVATAVERGGTGLSYPATQNLRLGGRARVGLGLYGYGMRGVSPAMRIETEVIGVRTVEAGEYVGYGQVYRAPQQMRIAILGIGYADGYPRSVNRGTVWIKGQRFPLVGSVCMDVCTARVDGADVRLGDRVVLPAADELAIEHGGIPYQYLTNWTARVGLKNIGSCNG